MNIFHSAREYLTPLLKESKFVENGLLTPEEFVAAGDFLVQKCPTWTWEAGDSQSVKSYLPEEKQFLVTRRVPCHHRVRELEQSTIERFAEGDDDWTVTDVNKASPPCDDFEDLDEHDEDKSEATDPVAQAAGDSDSDSCPDMDDFDISTQKVIEAVERVEIGNKSSSIVRSRTYDVSITYDKYWQTPRFWLLGYDEDTTPLTGDEMFEDVSVEHANKTATLEPHPHLSAKFISIHPCKHADMMKQIVGNLVEAGITPRVDQYLLLFLKFINTAVPSINYDHTYSMQA